MSPDNERKKTGGNGAGVGDHPALEMLNTVAKVDGQLVDALQTDDDVWRWLAGAGWPAAGNMPGFEPGFGHGSLLAAARILRDEIRVLVQQRKAGMQMEIEALNRFLANANSYLQIGSTPDGDLALTRQWRQSTPEQVLAPLAESAAELLTACDAKRIKPCENNDCVLWFYDRTKSQHRRWCSMATCGNRHKVSAFRQRQKHPAA